MTDLRHLVAGSSAQELDDWFARTDALEITDLLRGTDDATFADLLDQSDFRRAAVGAILARFTEFADPDRLASLRGTVCFDLAVRGRDRETHTLCFADGTVTQVELGRPDVTVGSTVLDFARLVTGQENAALLYLGGRLTVTGEAMLALSVGTVFSIPGSDRVAVDPTALDPVDVATAVATTSPEHMRAVMAGGFRPVVLQEVFRRFPEFIDPVRAGKLDLRVVFKVEGRGDGGADRFMVTVQRGTCTVVPDQEGGRRDATIALDGVAFLKLATGQLNPVTGVLTGAMRVRGDRGKALALNGAMNPPRPRRT